MKSSLTISVKYYGVPIFLDSGVRSMQVFPSATVADAIALLCTSEEELELLHTSIFMINRMPAFAATVLRDNDELMILNGMDGG